MDELAELNVKDYRRVNKMLAQHTWSHDSMPMNPKKTTTTAPFCERQAKEKRGE